MIENDDSEQSFNTTIREFVIYFLLFIILHFFSYAVISAHRKKISFYASEYEDAIVYQVSFWMCTFSLAISIEAALLLPISIISNEVLLYYPNSYYIHWLNSSLVQGLWNLTFLFSNVALFIFLPFAYFFTESQGFSGSHKGIKSRVYETFSVLLLLAVLILGMMYILSAIIDYEQIKLASLLSIWSYYLPFLYSCVSFLGVLMLLSCTPVGFAHLFTVVGALLVKPQTLKYIRHEFSNAGDGPAPRERRKKYFLHSRKKNEAIAVNKSLNSNSSETDDAHGKTRGDMDDLLKVKSYERSLGYTAAMVLLLVFTVISVLIVAQNILALCFGIKTLPIYPQNFSLGISSLSALGPLGAFFEIILILYLWCSSVVGLYSMPFFCHLKPKLHDTSMIHIIGNCAVLLVLSSALPVLARTLGITNFDLLGDFGRIHWLGNFYIVLFYNIVFAVATAMCLGTKITATVREELTNRLFALSMVKFFSTYDSTLFQVKAKIGDSSKTG